MDTNRKFTVYMNDLIIFDINNDSFSLVENINLDGKFYKLIKQIDDEFSILRELNIVPNINFLEKNDISLGFLEERWFYPDSSYRKSNLGLSIYNLYIFLLVLKCKFILNRKGIKGALDYICKKRNMNKSNSSRSLEDIINKVSTYFVSNKIENNCILYSFCLTVILLSNGINCNLIVGVRSRPFYAHAWVEVNNNVINDDVNIREKLSVILEG